jgi:serine/threonine protein kinase
MTELSLGRYQITEQIGAGGMGVVYRARDQRLDRDVAVKILPPGSLTDQSSRSRFRKEALALSRLTLQISPSSTTLTLSIAPISWSWNWCPA